MIIGIGTPSSQSRIPRPIVPSTIFYQNGMQECPQPPVLVNRATGVIAKSTPAAVFPLVLCPARRTTQARLTATCTAKESAGAPSRDATCSHMPPTPG